MSHISWLYALVLVLALYLPSAAQPRLAQAAVPVRASGWTYAQVQGTIDRAAWEFGVSAYWMERVAWCESAWNPYATNYSGASGLFQFMPATFWGYVYRLWWPRGTWLSPYNPYVAARLTAWMWRAGMASQWTCSYITGFLR